MNPRLTDQAVSELPLSRGRAELLEEIMSTPVDHADPDHADSVHADSVHAERPRRWLAPIAAAVLVAGVVAVPSHLLSGDEPRTAAPATSGSPVPAVPAAPAAQEWVVLEAPGWTLSHVSDSGDSREVTYENAGASVEVYLNQAEERGSYVEDRSQIGARGRQEGGSASSGDPVTLLGEAARMWAYSADDHTSIGVVFGTLYPEVRGSGMDRDAYLELLGQLRWTDQAGFEATLPTPFVRSEDRADVIEQMTADMEMPPGLGPITSTEVDRYQLGADVAGTVACAWLERFEKASAEGDAASANAAAEALSRSHDWEVLEEMKAEGGYPGVLWQYAAQVAGGEVPEGFRGGLGCP